MMRPLKRDEVGVSFFPSGRREILPESEFTLVDRTFQVGDYCKRSVDDVCSGIVTSVNVKGRLVHAISGVPVEGWISKQEFDARTEPEIGDYVVYDDWVGQARKISN
jgi:ubiquitin-conjugating enzyme E2 O